MGEVAQLLQYLSGARNVLKIGWVEKQPVDNRKLLRWRWNRKYMELRFREERAAAAQRDQLEQLQRKLASGKMLSSEELAELRAGLTRAASANQRNARGLGPAEETATGQPPGPALGSVARITSAGHNRPATAGGGGEGGDGGGGGEAGGDEAGGAVGARPRTAGGRPGADAVRPRTAGRTRLTPSSSVSSFPPAPPPSAPLAERLDATPLHHASGLGEGLAALLRPVPRPVLQERGRLPRARSAALLRRLSPEPPPPAAPTHLDDAGDMLDEAFRAGGIEDLGSKLAPRLRAAVKGLRSLESSLDSLGADQAHDVFRLMVSREMRAGYRAAASIGAL